MSAKSSKELNKSQARMNDGAICMIDLCDRFV